MSRTTVIRLWAWLAACGLACGSACGADDSSDWNGVAFPQAGVQGLRAWFVLPASLVREDAALPEGQPVPYTLHAGRGEYECLQCVVRPDAAMQAVSVACGELTGPAGRIPAAAWTANRVGMIEIKAGSGAKARSRGLVPDPLLPDATFDLPAGRTTSVWLTVRVPNDARPGTYQGQVVLRQGERTVARFPLALQVWDFAIPEQTHLVVMGNVWTNEAWFARHCRASLWECLKPYYDNLKAHRLNATASVYPIKGPWSASGRPEGLEECQKALHYVLDDLGMVRFRFPGVGGAAGGTWNKLSVFQPAQPQQGLWIDGRQFARAQPPAKRGGPWRTTGGASLTSRPRGSAEVWLEYDFATQQSQSLWVWLQVNTAQDTETKTVALDGTALGTLRGADFSQGPLGFARLQRPVDLAPGKHTLRVELGGIHGVSDPLCGIYLTPGEQFDPAGLLREMAVLDPQFQAAFREHVEQVAGFLGQHGWLAKAQMKLKDEPTVGEYGRVAAVYEFARELLPDGKRELSEEPCPLLERGVNVWTPYATRFDPQAAARLQQAGHEVWMYWNALHGAGQSPVGVRLLPWMLWKYRLDGYLFWSVNCWSVDPWEAGSCAENSSLRGTFLYPNPQDGTPINSARWELFREGLEDYETLRLLHQAVDQGQARPPTDPDRAAALRQAQEVLERDVPQLVRTLLDFSKDPAEFEAVRTKMGAALDALHPEQP